MIRLNNISKKYDDQLVIDNLSMNIEDGDIVGIFGKSGIGKTTLINIIAGITEVDSGNISGCEKISIMFQDDRLLEWYTVYQNLFIILKDKEKIEKWLNDFKLIDIKDKYINELSGGMKRKIALIRALSFDSETVLLDEPFSGIDKSGRDEIINIIKEYQKLHNKTIVIISHDIDDILNLAKNIVILNKGLKIVERVDIKEENINYIKEIIEGQQ